MGAPRVNLRFIERDLEKVIREIALQAHTVDDNATTGPAFRALFPDQALAQFKATLEARQIAEGKLSQARAVESGARERFVKA